MSWDPITSLSGPTRTDNASSAATKASAQSLDYDAFLKLLIAQVEFQDPLEPVDSTEYVAQLATFAQVEQSISTNERMAELLMTSRVASIESLVGRTLSSADGTVSGTVESVRIDDNRSIAKLATGEEVEIGPGITIY